MVRPYNTKHFSCNCNPFRTKMKTNEKNNNKRKEQKIMKERTRKKEIKPRKIFILNDQIEQQKK